MKHFTKLFATTVVLGMSLGFSAPAQTVLSLPGKAQAPAQALANPAKATPAASQLSLPAALRGALVSESDIAAYQASNGAQLPSFAPVQSPYGPEDETLYNYIGFNVNAGLAEDGATAIAGMVGFNVNPFACDTLASDSKFSPYSYVQDGKLYCFIPNQNSNYSGYSGVTRTIYNASTLELIESNTFTFDGDVTSDRVPYMLTYDDVRDVVWAISMGPGSSAPDGGQPFYLNILDTATCKLKRVGYLGSYLMSRSSGNFSPKAFVAGYGTLYTTYVDNDQFVLSRIDPVACTLTRVGYSAKIPTQYVYGFQPMVYNSSMGRFLINHYDFTNGTQFYEMSTFTPWGSELDTIPTTLIENAPTGFTYMYANPAAATSNTTMTLDKISDLVITPNADGTELTLDFTVPNTVNGGEEIEFPDWAYKTARVYMYIDNSYTNMTGLTANQPDLGSHQTVTAPVTPGMHIVTLQIYPSYTSVAQSRTAQIITCGYDAPAAVTNATLTISEDNVASISWTAPTEGRYVDFGSNFDASDLSYRVVRNNDGVVVAEGITETSCTDADLAEEIQTYQYTIYAISHENAGVGTLTNKATGGSYLPLPYFNAFSEATDLDGFTIINANNDGTYRTWQWNYYYGYIFDGSSITNDWFISPTFKLEADSLYEFSFTTRGIGKLIATVGTGVTADDQTVELGSIENTNYEFIQQNFFFRPTADGDYHFGLWSHSTAQEHNWAVDNYSVRVVSNENAPEKVRNLTWNPAEAGALSGTLNFTLPSTDINGNTISALTSAVVTDNNGTELAAITDVAPGAEAAITVNAEHGWNMFRVYATSEAGNGYPVVIRQFVGPDVPQAVQGLKATWGEEDNIVNLTWNVDVKGVNGGYVDPSAVTYKLYKYTGGWPQYTELASTSDNEVELQLLDIDVTKQEQYVLGVTALSSEGESDYSRVGIVLGEPDALPYDEPFAAAGLQHDIYLVMAGKNNQAWTTDEGYFNYNILPQNNDGLQLLLRNTGIEDGSGKFVSSIIDFTTAEKPMMSAWFYHGEAMAEDAYVTVTATIDGSNEHIAVSDTASLTGNSGWTQHFFDLSKLAGHKAQIAVDGYMPDAATRIFMDNWAIYEATGNDLALTAISQPENPVVGDVITVTIDVANKGTETANDYSVLFIVNDEAVAEMEADEALAPGKTETYAFSLPLSPTMDEVIYSAQVIYDGDTDETNNFSTEVELTPEQLDLPAPTNLAADGDNDMVWDAPEAMDGREVTLDFEKQAPFLADNIADWKTYDGDGHLTSGFVQYYNNYWPYFNQPLAYMVWDTKAAGCPSAAAWQVHQGERGLIHWGNYGIDAEGYDNSSEPEDDWFISPELKGGSEFSFWTSANDLSNVVEVLASSTTQDVEAFTTTVTSVDYTATATWKQVTVTVPEDAKYVALHTIADGFGTLFDDFAYTLAQSPMLLGYNVYKNGEFVRFVNDPSAVTDGEGDYTVTALYDLGESEESNVLSVSSGVNDATRSSVHVIAGQGTITIVGGMGSAFGVHNVAGQTFATGKSNGNVTVNVPAGIYVVNVAGKAFKVIVK